MAAATTPTEKQLRDILEITLFQAEELERFLIDEDIFPKSKSPQSVRDATFELRKGYPENLKLSLGNDHPLSRLFEAYNDVKDEAELEAEMEEEEQLEKAETKCRKRELEGAKYEAVTGLLAIFAERKDSK